MEVYEVFINQEKGKSGVHAISLVESPAIDIDFIALKSDKVIHLAEIDKEKRLIMGAVLVPNKPIYRKVGEKEFYIIFSKDTIREASELYLKNGSQSNTTLDHKINLSGVTLVESWIVDDVEKDKSNAYNLSVPVGSWMISMKVDNDEIWADYIKTGDIKGFSIEGFFDAEIQSNLNSHKMDKKVLTILEKIEAYLKPDKKVEEIKLEEVTTDDGAILFAETFEAGEAIFIVTEDERQPLPIGEYLLDDGRTVVIEEDGIVASIKDAASADDETDDPQELAKIMQVNKWEMDVENESFAVGDKVLVKSGDEGEPFALQAGEYVLEDGRTMQVDSEGVVVLISGGESDEETEMSSEDRTALKAVLVDLLKEIKQDEIDAEAAKKDSKKDGKQDFSKMPKFSPEGKAKKGVGYKMPSTGLGKKKTIYEKLYN